MLGWCWKIGSSSVWVYNLTLLMVVVGKSKKVEEFTILGVELVLIKTKIVFVMASITLVFMNSNSNIVGGVCYISSTPSSLMQPDLSYVLSFKSKWHGFQ